MTTDELVKLPFAELRDRLKASAEELDSAEAIDLMDVLRYLTMLPDCAHGPDSVDALFHLSRNFFIASRPTQTIQAASLASRLAIALEQNNLLCKARGMEGVALCHLGKFAESAAALADFWTQARLLGDVQRETLAIKNVGSLYAAMAQWSIASVYCRRSWELAAAHGYTHLELGSRVNFANCALQLSDAASGLSALLPAATGAPNTKAEAATYASAHVTLGHLYLLTGETDRARTHAHEAGRCAQLGGYKRTLQLHTTLLGLIDVKSGEVERGLAAVESGLAFAKRVNHLDVADYLSMCVDACEAAGRSDRALAYLHELVAWKKNLIDAEIPQHEGLIEPLQLEVGDSVFDDQLRVRAQWLQADVRQTIRRFVETAINAEIASGHDLYRTFRVAKLARCLAIAIGWDEERVNSLALGAQLSNVGMVAIPTRVLHKPTGLSDSEHNILRTHPVYGAELLRKPRLRVFDVASVVAEQHHERFDGSGYPRGLAGEAIGEEARVVAVCDAFDAMTHTRPWRRMPLAVDEALNELKQGARSQFDPRLVNAFVELVGRELQEHDDFDAFLSAGADEYEYVRVRARIETLMAGGSESRLHPT
ncbi:MAG TPA: HD domain-containing phosphohydrolase [Burkholderiaceae bacterium]|nr:HD domain-containing phosphohydrolase [Burkholderiaceae bacterium]